MMTVKYYKSLEEKEQFKREALTRGESTKHNDFIDIDGKPTDGKSGRLTFEVLQTPDLTEFNRLKVLINKIKDDTATLSEMRELKRLEMGL